MFSRAKKAATPKALPVRRWHAWQWQTETFDGSPLVVTRNWPQEQVARRSIMRVRQAERATGAKGLVSADWR
jgi:hypothetical protein